MPTCISRSEIKLVFVSQIDAFPIAIKLNFLKIVSNDIQVEQSSVGL